MGDVSLNRPIKAEPAAGDCELQGNQVLDTMSVGWTDERHMRYISSMEASFIDQLQHNHDQLQHNHGHQSHCGNSRGFKVLRGGVWEYIKYEKSNDGAQSRTRYCLPSSPWIQHFKPRHLGTSVQNDVVKDSEGDYESGTQTNRKRISLSHGRKKESCNGENQLRVERTEVSDQNFACDEVQVDAESSNGSKRKKPTATEMLADQVNSRDQSA